MAEPYGHEDDIKEEDLNELAAFLNTGPDPDSEEALAAPIVPLVPSAGLTGEDNAEVEVRLAAEVDQLYAVEAWEDLGLSDELIGGIYEMGYAKPAKIQAWTMPIAIQGGNIIAQALNGSGKTAAFALSMLSKVKAEDKWTQGLCLCHTRELAAQNHEVIQRLGKNCGIEMELCVAGYNPKWVQAGIVVGTPGKLNDLIRRRALDVRWTTMFVIDEADHMIDQDQSGTQVISIRDALPKDGLQILLFSATWPEDVEAFADRMVPGASKIMVKKEELTLADITQYWMDTPEDQKLKSLKDLYGSMSLNQSIIFVNTRAKAFKIAKAMKTEGYTVSLICGTQAEGPEKMELWKRDKIMTEFRTGVSKVLIATDILARGIDVPAVTMVVNYDLPRKFAGRGQPKTPDAESYLHRIGRTGRFGLKGVAVNFVPPQEKDLLEALKSHYQCDVVQLQGEPEEMEAIMQTAHGRF